MAQSSSTSDLKPNFGSYELQNCAMILITQNKEIYLFWHIILPNKQIKYNVIIHFTKNRSVFNFNSIVFTVHYKQLYNISLKLYKTMFQVYLCFI